jgi:YgiT-type zinc finger domain-containing protein
MSVIEVVVESDQQPVADCANCGSPELSITRVRSAFWHRDRLVVVEDIPAIVCERCHEQYYDDRTAVRLDLMRGEGFPPDAASREVNVPVFSFTDFASRES